MKKEKLTRVVNPLINTRPNIYYIEETALLDWPVEPTLPGGEHMAPAFWKPSGKGV